MHHQRPVSEISLPCFADNLIHMATLNSQDDKTLKAGEGSGPEPAPREQNAEAAVPEFDRRGVQLPARARVGGIIIPQ